jgi:hypothetical protein
MRVTFCRGGVVSFCVFGFALSGGGGVCMCVCLCGEGRRKGIGEREKAYLIRLPCRFMHKRMLGNQIPMRQRRRLRQSGSPTTIQPRGRRNVCCLFIIEP